MHQCRAHRFGIVAVSIQAPGLDRNDLVAHKMRDTSPTSSRNACERAASAIYDLQTISGTTHKAISHPHIAPWRQCCSPRCSGLDHYSLQWMVSYRMHLHLASRDGHRLQKAHFQRYPMRLLQTSVLRVDLSELLWSKRLLPEQHFSQLLTISLGCRLKCAGKFASIWHHFLHTFLYRQGQL